MCHPFERSECIVTDDDEEAGVCYEDLAYYELFQEQFLEKQLDRK